MSNPISKFANGRILTILVLGFASGLPLPLTTSTLQAWFTEANVSILTVGALSLVGIPYLLKFIWAPIMDHYHISSLGKSKSWMLLTQLGLVTTLLILSNMHPQNDATWIGFIALLIAFFSASQDISVTAYQTDVLNPEERGLGTASYIFGYRMAMLFSGGVALILADHYGWKLVYQIMAVTILLCMIPTYAAPRANEPAVHTQNLFETVIAAVKDLLSREKIALILLFILLYKIGDAFALQLMMNFLLHGLGFTLSEVGIAYKTVSIVAMILGSFVGGVLLTRWNIYKALMIFGIMQAISTGMFVLLSIAGKNFALLTTTIFIENFCSGLSTIALLAFMMSLCDHHFTASQFALFSAVASLGRVFSGPLAGLIVKNFGWVQFFSWSVMLCLPSLFLLLLIKNEVSSYAVAASS